MSVSSHASRSFLLFAVAGLLAGICFMRGSAAGLASVRQASSGPGVGTTCPEMEDFLKTAKIGRTRQLSVGVTGPSRATLNSGAIEHDAEIQTVDVSKATFEGTRGSELNFRDSWKYNVAGYELAKILSLDMVPPYVERHVEGQLASVAWWINDATMERDRYKKKIVPPNLESWNGEMYVVRVFHQLIYDTDPNLTNILIAKDWRIWMIDFTRAFRLMKNLQNPKDLVKCDRRLLASLRTLNTDLLQQKVGRWLTKPEIEGLISRRDLIVKFFDGEVARRGEGALLYDTARTAEPCGTGLR